MTSTKRIRDFKPTGTHQKIALLLLAGLLFLRLPLVAGVLYFVKTLPDWLNSVFQIGTYLLTAFLIWWEKDRLADFHIDGLAVAIILLFKPIQTIILDPWGLGGSSLAFPNPVSLIVWAIAIALTLALWKSHPKVLKPKVNSLGWFIIGTLGGIVTAIILGFPISFQVSPSDISVAFGPKPQLVKFLVLCCQVSYTKSDMPLLQKSRYSADFFGGTCAERDGETFGYGCFRRRCSGLVISTT